MWSTYIFLKLWQKNLNLKIACWFDLYVIKMVTSILLVSQWIVLTNIILAFRITFPYSGGGQKCCKQSVSHRHKWSAFQSVGIHVVNWVATKNVFILLSSSFFFLFFSSIATFSYRRSTQIKKIILKKLRGVPKSQGVNTFPDPVGPWWPF